MMPFFFNGSGCKWRDENQHSPMRHWRECWCQCIFHPQGWTWDPICCVHSVRHWPVSRCCTHTITHTTCCALSYQSRKHTQVLAGVGFYGRSSNLCKYHPTNIKRLRENKLPDMFLRLFVTCVFSFEQIEHYYIVGFYIEEALVAQRSLDPTPLSWTPEQSPYPKTDQTCAKSNMQITCCSVETTENTDICWHPFASQCQILWKYTALIKEKKKHAAILNWKVKTEFSVYSEL